jgi:general secretion pathway protein D
VYPEVERWLERLDQPVQETGIRTFIYRVENGKADNLASVLNALLLGANLAPSPEPAAEAQPAGGMIPGGPGAAPGAVPTTVSLLAEAQARRTAVPELSHLRIVPDLLNNQLVIQATTQEYEQIQQILRDLDIVPRQVMIEAKVYEVDLTGDLSAGVTAFLQRRTAGGQDKRGTGGFGVGAAGTTALNATMGTLIGKMRELIIELSAAESRGDARVISAPSILASDNLAASISVGTEIPLLSSQVTGLSGQTAGNPVFTNTIQNRDTGVLLTITPRINSSGLVTLGIAQEVSAPLPAAAGAAIQSTQAVVQDGETIALGGIIQESRTYSRNRIPLLGDIPYVGALFGNTTLSTQRTELILLLTPTVIRDTSEARIATAEFRNKLRDLSKIIAEEEKREQERREEAGGSSQ